MITKFIKFIELNFPVITRGSDIEVGMLKGPVLAPLGVNSINVEFLKEQKRTLGASRLRIFLSKEILQERMMILYTGHLFMTRGKRDAAVGKRFRFLNGQ
ncbi:hypothetical protein Tco_1575176 [Tanacetum coccineum]